MAMAVRSKNSHYRFAEIRRKHWNAVAKNNAVSADFEPVIRHFIDITPSVIEAIAVRLPKGFPVRISEAVFDGIRAQIKRLEAQ